MSPDAEPAKRRSGRKVEERRLRAERSEGMSDASRNPFACWSRFAGPVNYSAATCGSRPRIEWTPRVRRVDSPRRSRTAHVSNHRNVWFTLSASTGAAAQLLRADLHEHRLSTESTGPTTTTEFPIDPSSYNIREHGEVWTTRPPARAWQDALPGFLPRDSSH
jgi:hypothetical protein